MSGGRRPVRFDLVGGQQPRSDELSKHGLPPFAIRQRREELFTAANGARSLRGRQVAEDPADELFVFRRNCFESCLGVPGQRPFDASDLPIRLAGQELLLLVSFLPEPGNREREKGQHAANSLDGTQDLLDESFVLESVTLPAGGLDNRTPQPISREGSQRHQVAENRQEGFVLLAPHQEVVAQREKNMNVGLRGQASEKLDEPCLCLWCIEREDLLELIDDDQGLLMGLSPADEQPEGRFRILKSRKPSQSFRVPGQFGPERLADSPQRSRSRCRHNHRPTFRRGRGDTRVDEGCLTGTRRPDHRLHASLLKLFPNRLDFFLAAEEGTGVGRGEGGKSRVRVLFPYRQESGMAASPFEDALERQRKVLCRLKPILRPLFQASAEDPVERWRDFCLSRGRHRLLHDRDQCRCQGPSKKRVLMAEELGKDYSQGEDVRAVVYVPCRYLLRR